MKISTKLLSIHIPLALVITFLGYLVFGAIPGVALTGDLIAWLLELPVVLIYALVAVGLSVGFMNIIGANIENDKRCELVKLAYEGNRDALYVLIMESVTWLLVFSTCALFFYPHR
jgi:hypothetical protein